MQDKSRRTFLFAAGTGAAAMGTGFSAVATPEGAHDAAVAADVTNFGAKGDGVTHCGAAFQRAIDAAESAGGGIVHVPPGRYLLERTPLIASHVHLKGAGAATVLCGLRPDNHRGAALISNKGQQAPGYEGAHDWSISYLTIDSPHTNGIVVTHATRVYIGHIYGVDVYHHFVDTAGRDILCEHLFLTGRSGTSTFQVDSLSGAQTIWDGQEAVSPLLDGTDTENLILQNAIITATAGHTGHRPHHNTSIHFHGDEAQGFIFNNLLLGGATTGFYQDANTAYHNMQITNVQCANPGRALWFNPGKTQQRNLMIRGLIHTPDHAANDTETYAGMELYGRDGLLVLDVQLNSEHHRGTDFGLRVAASQQVHISSVQAVGTQGRGIWLHDHGDDTGSKTEQILIQGCMLRGFETGCVHDGTGTVHVSDNLFHEVSRHYHGNFTGK